MELIKRNYVLFLYNIKTFMMKKRISYVIVKILKCVRIDMSRNLICIRNMS